jgi:hypothetical protein
VYVYGDNNTESCGRIHALTNSATTILLGRDPNKDASIYVEMTPLCTFTLHNARPFIPSLTERNNQSFNL